MKYAIFNVDEVKPLKKSYEPNAPTQLFRIVITGANNTGKTNIVLNVLTMDKIYYMFREKKSLKIGEWYVKCNDIVLVGHHLNEPKYKIVSSFYKYLS